MLTAPHEIGVDIWTAHVVPWDAADSLVGILTNDELVRAAAFRFEQHQREFITGRALLRTIVGRCCGIAPQDVRLHCTRLGQPRLGNGGFDVEFSVSHSAGLVMLAVTGHHRRIGIDVERVDRNLDVESLRYVLTPEEDRLLSAARPDERARTFLRLWTRKEAFAKATGLGLSLSLAGVQTVGDSIRMIAPTIERSCVGSWYVEDLPAPPRFVVAVVVEGGKPNVRFRSWSQCPEDHDSEMTSRSI